MASLGKLVDALISAVEAHREPGENRLDEIRRLDAEFGAECLKRNLPLPAFEENNGSYRPFGQTRIPHFCSRQPRHYHFRATDNWRQAMRAIAMTDVERMADGEAEPVEDFEPSPCPKCRGQRYVTSTRKTYRYVRCPACKKSIKVSRGTATRAVT